MSRWGEALARWVRSWGPEDGGRETAGSPGKSGDEGRRSAEHRRRFWVELREGQREADERARTCH